MTLGRGVPQCQRCVQHLCAARLRKNFRSLLIRAAPARPPGVKAEGD